MKQFWIVGLASTVWVSLPLLAEAAVFTYSVPLEASQEVAPNFSDSQATGTATGALDGIPTDWVFSYTVDYSGLEAGLADGHIHLGDRGTNGPVTHFLDNIDNFVGTTTGTVVGDWTSADVITAGLVPPEVVYNSFLEGNYYFNIHTEAFPGGEIRGQIEPLSRVPEPSLVLGLLSLGLLQAASRLGKFKQKG